MGDGGVDHWEEIESFVQSPWFEDVCDGAAWDPPWVRELFGSIFAMADEPEDVRLQIIIQAVRLAKDLARLDLPEQ